MIKVFHGSTQEIQQPDVKKGRDNLDFGKAFYDRHLRFVSSEILPRE